MKSRWLVNLGLLLLIAGLGLFLYFNPKKEAPTFNEALAQGRTRMWRVLGFNLLVGLAGFIVVLPILLLALVLMGASVGAMFRAKKRAPAKRS